MNSRSEKDVVMGGFVGVTIAAIVAGFFAILAMAGAMGNDMAAVTTAGKGDMFIGSIAQVGSLSRFMFWVFVIACICPTGFCAFLASNAFATMFPKLPRMGMTLAAGVVGVVLAATGVANNLVGFFLIIGASFGPILGAMVADYLRNGKWTGPRKGVNWAGYVAWGLGFLVGILNVFNAKWGYGLETLMSFIVGLAVYLIAAELGLEPEVVELEKK
jgi:cytosine permease